MLRLAAAIFVVTATAQAADPVRAPAASGIRPRGQAAAVPTSAPWLSRLSSYLEAVNEHKPGSLDMAARLTGFMGEGDLDEVRADYFALVAICKRELGRSVRPAPIVYRDTVIPFPDLRRVLGLTDDEAEKGNANRVLQRAAVLHADVAMLVIPLLPGRAGCSARPTLLVKDGSRVGSGCIGFHWTHGRFLLDAVRPDPGRDPVVRLWYLASITYMLEMGDFANADSQIGRARLLFPDDPAILFEHGFYHEGFASPLIQTAAFESGADTRGAKVHLEEADDLYRRAIKENPQFVEARVRRGYVLGLLGHHRGAAEDLRLAVAAAAGRQLPYYAELFLGHAEESLGNRAEARDHYRQASALYPQAQSPLLALALLARQSGDRAGAQGAMRQLLALPRARVADQDPWWRYRRFHNQGYEAVFDELHALIHVEAKASTSMSTLVEAEASTSIATAVPRKMEVDPSGSTRPASTSTSTSTSIQTTPAQTQNPTFSSKVEAVRVDVLVTEDGNPVRGLRADDFEIFDNGVRQVVDIASFEQLPINVVFTFDLSDSIVGERLANLREAGHAVLDGLKKDDRAALVAFNDAVVVGPGLTADAGLVKAAIDRADPTGNTSLIDAGFAGMMLAESDVGRGLVIVFSDGLDTSSWLRPKPVLDVARRSDAVVYAVSAGLATRAEFLGDLAEQTGGRLFKIESTRGLSAVFLEVLGEFRQRYLVSYSPTGVPQEGWHQLTVRVKGRNATVRARPGYLAGQ